MINDFMAEGTMEITLGSDQSKLVLGPIYGIELPIQYLNSGIEISNSTVLFEEGPQLQEFFKELADNWSGWQGEKTWTSLEDDFELIAKNDGFSSVAIKFRMTKCMGDPDDWEFTGHIVIELGQLESISKEIELLLRS